MTVPSSSSLCTMRTLRVRSPYTESSVEVSARFIPVTDGIYRVSKSLPPLMTKLISVSPGTPSLSGSGDWQSTVPTGFDDLVYVTFPTESFASSSIRRASGSVLSAKSGTFTEGTYPELFPRLT